LKIFVKRAVFTFIIFLIAFLTLEAIIGYFEKTPEKIRDSKLLWKNPVTRKVEAYNKNLNTMFSIRYNADGFRGNELINTQESIFLLGDSFIEATYLPDSMILASYLYAITEMERFQVINAGCNGYGMDQKYLVLS